MVKFLRAIVCALLVFLGLVAAAPGAQAAPLPAPYSGQAGGDVAAVDLTVLGGLTLADVRLANSDSTVDSTATPESSSVSRNLAATVAGLGITVEETSQTAPPDNAGPVGDSIASASALGITTGLLTTSNEAHYTNDASCVTDDALAATTTSTAGLTVTPAGLVNVLTTGVSTTSGTVELVSTGGAGFNRAVQSTTVGELAGVSLLGGGVTIDIADALLTATAPGTPDDAEVTYNEPLVTVNGSPVGATGTVTVDLGTVGAVTVTVNDPTVTEAPDGTSATGSVSVVTLDVRVGPLAAPLATATVDLLPLTASAEAPVGGIDCPPPAPVVETPADGAVINDATPTFSGTGTAGATIDLVVDGTTINDAATVDGGGEWEYTPTTGLADGPHTVSATQTLNGATSVASAENAFVIDTDAPDAPVITDPDDGSTTNDATPTITGTGEPGATVTVEVDGDEVGEATVDGTGNWELPLTDALDDGEHTITATQTDEAGNESGADEVTFVVDTGVSPPVITAPEEGSSTNDTTPTIEGTAEPGATVAVEVDGTPVGTVTADGDGNWSLELTDPLDEGDHTVSAVQIDVAGNESDPAENDFTVDTTAPAAPVITSPDDGDTIADPSPTIEGTGEPGTTIVILVDGEPVGSVVVDEDGNWSFTLPELPDGEYTIAAIAVDEAGNESEADEITITIDRPELADTGGPSLGYAVAGGVLLVVGGTVLSLTRRRV